MYALLVFVLLLVLVLLAAAALAWPLHTLLTLWFEPELESVISRTVLGLGILVFLAVFRKAGFSSWRDIGYSSGHGQFWRDAVRGFAVGILIMAPVVAGLLLVQNRVPDWNWHWSAGNLVVLLASALAAGGIVALIEETLFRGALLTAVLRRSSVLLAVASTSLFYSLVHFLRPEQELDHYNLDWTSSFVLLQDAVSTLLRPLLYLDTFIALFAAGMLLAIIRIRTGRLAICIGIHAGWVFTIKIFKRLTNSNDASPFAFLTGAYDHVTGYLAAACLLAAVLIYIKISQRSRSECP